jgi:hypothetical protein
MQGIRALESFLGLIDPTQVHTQRSTFENLVLLLEQQVKTIFQLLWVVLGKNCGVLQSNHFHY